MSERLLDQINKINNATKYFHLFPFVKVNEVKEVGQFSYKKNIVNLPSYKFETEFLNFKFTNLNQALQFFLTDYTQSQIESLISAISFYNKILPYTDNDCNDTIDVEVLIREHHHSYRFKFFEIIFSGNLQIFFGHDSKKEIMNDSSFESLYSSIINEFNKRLKFIFGDTVNKFDNKFFSKLIKVKNSDDFMALKFDSILKYEKSLNFAKKVKSIKNIKIHKDKNIINSFNEDFIYIFGDERVEKKIENINKNNESIIWIYKKNIDIVDILLKNVLKKDEIDFVKKTILLYVKHSEAFNRYEPFIRISRKNLGKRSIKNLHSESTFMMFSVGKHRIELGTSINGCLCNNEHKFYYSENVEDFFNYMKLKSMQEIANELNLEANDVKDEDYDLISMIKY